jgi:hypothetical protein
MGSASSCGGEAAATMSSPHRCESPRHSTYYARKLDLPPTTAHNSNLVVKPGKGSLSDLIANVDKGVYVTSWLGGNSDSTSGEFSLGLRGNLITKGKLGAPVAEMNVTGNVLQLFSRLAVVGGDVWKYSSVQPRVQRFRAHSVSVRCHSAARGTAGRTPRSGATPRSRPRARAGSVAPSSSARTEPRSSPRPRAP